MAKLSNVYVQTRPFIKRVWGDISLALQFFQNVILAPNCLKTPDFTSKMPQNLLYSQISAV